jgi:hypothetical protein
MKEHKISWIKVNFRQGGQQGVDQILRLCHILMKLVDNKRESRPGILHTHEQKWKLGLEYYALMNKRGKNEAWNITQPRT